MNKDGNNSTKIDCNKDRKHIECLKIQEREFIEYLSGEDDKIQNFYSLTQGYAKIKDITRKQDFTKRYLNFTEGIEVEDNIDFLFKTFKGSKLISDMNCQKEVNYTNCTASKKNLLDIIFTSRDWLFDCEQVVEHIKTTAKRKENKKRLFI